MSLVAYDSSDEDSENGENESAGTINVNNNNDEIEVITAPMNCKLSLPAPKMCTKNLNDKEEQEEDTENLKTFLGMLPKPKDHSSERDSIVNIEEEDDILLKKTKMHVIKPVKKQTVKITVPSLSEFKDLEEENEQKPKEIIQPSGTGCGLFSILVPPKEQTTNSAKILIPQAVKNAATRMSIRETKTLKESHTNKMNVSKTENIAANKSLDEVNSDDEEDGADFFGLTSGKKVPANSTMELLDQKLHASNFIGNLNNENTRLTKHMEDNTMCDIFSSGSTASVNEQSNKTLTSNIMNLSKENIILKNKAEVGPKLPVPEQEYNVDTEGNIAFDEKAIEYLCGKRGIKRKDREIDEANIIEINGEDIKPDEREWLVKALTEESVQRPISMQSCGINSQSKKKHQITYLAHQAKAMELELKNQWSQNKMARKQTKSKYGF